MSGGRYGEENPLEDPNNAIGPSTTLLDGQPRSKRASSINALGRGSSNKLPDLFPSLADSAYLTNVRKKVKVNPFLCTLVFTPWRHQHSPTFYRAGPSALLFLTGFVPKWKNSPSRISFTFLPHSPRKGTSVQSLGGAWRYSFLLGKITKISNVGGVASGGQEDRDLLVGSYIHGLGSFESICADEALCFHRHRHTLTTLTSDSTEETGHKPPKASSRGSGTVGTNTEPERSKLSNGRSKEQEEEDEFELAIDEDEEEEEEDADEEDDDSHDDHQEGVETAKGRWPAKRVLNLRVKVLLDIIDKTLRAEARERQRLEKLKSKEDRKRMREDEREQRLQKRQKRQVVKRQKLEERRTQWSKRERGDFRVALMAYGPGTITKQHHQ